MGPMKFGKYGLDSYKANSTSLGFRKFLDCAWTYNAPAILFYALFCHLRNRNKLSDCFINRATGEASEMMRKEFYKL